MTVCQLTKAHKGWERVWGLIKKTYGLDPCGCCGEQWQYMGTYFGVKPEGHNFRHRHLNKLTDMGIFIPVEADDFKKRDDT